LLMICLLLAVYPFFIEQHLKRSVLCGFVGLGMIHSSAT